MADWNKPVPTDLWSTFLDSIKSRDTDVANMFSAEPTNPADGFVRLVRLTGNKVKFQERSGGNWVDRVLDVAGGGTGGTSGSTPADATEAQKGIVELATQTEANALSDTSRALTPGRVPSGSESQKGVAQAATDAEVTARTDINKYVQPHQIPAAGSVSSASETAQGVIEIATQTEANALSDATRALTPGRVPSATTIQSGIVRQATSTEVTNRTSVTAFVTPADIPAASTGTTPGSSTVGTGQLKTTTGSSSGSIAGSGNAIISINAYAFFPAIRNTSSNPGQVQMLATNASASASPTFRLKNTLSGQTQTYNVQWRYITATHNPHVFVRRSTDDIIISVWEAEDPADGIPLAIDPDETTTDTIVNCDVPPVTLLTALYSNNAAALALLKPLIEAEGWSANFDNINKIDSDVPTEKQKMARLLALRSLANAENQDMYHYLVSRVKVSADGTWRAV